MSANHWIGVDLGGTKILAGLFDDELKLVTKAKVATDAGQGPAAVFERIAEVVARARDQARHGGGRIAGLGLCVPGQINPQTGMVYFAPNLDWHDLTVTPFLPKGWDFPVIVENDVRLGTYGEFKHGAARGAKHVLGVFAGTGVGGGLVLNGELYAGFNFNAGEIGHTIIHWRKGTELESIAGRKALLGRADAFLEDAPKRLRRDWKQYDLAAAKSSFIADLWQKGDPVAMQLVDDAARALGVALASAINLLSPEVVILGGGMAGALGESFLELVWEITCRYTLPRATQNVRFVPAQLGDLSGVVGAAAYARERVLKGGK
jgi:glucokinase